MNIKSLLLGSAAALVAVSGARAADAVVIPEPEAVEYVRVCDAAGAGYFYIPGSETCLRFSGYVRYEMNFTNQDYGYVKAAADDDAFEFNGAVVGIKKDETAFDRVNRFTEGGGDLVALTAGLKEADVAALLKDPLVTEPADNDGYGKASDVRVDIEAWNDTELGPLYSRIRLGYDSHPDVDGDNDASGFSIDHAVIQLAGLTIGKNASWWDWGFGADADALVNFGPGEVGMVAYTANAGGFGITLALEEDNDSDYMPDVVFDVDGSVGDFAVRAGLAYNESAEALTGKIYAAYDFGPATLGLGYQYSPEKSLGADYLAAYEHVIGADLSADLTEKLAARAGVNYGMNWYSLGVDALVLGAGVNYEVVSGFDIDARVNHTMYSNDGDVLDNVTSARIRFTRSF